ncbi:hypothetical protein ACVW0W_001036 [Bradyrhizobium sp. USDA 4469]
MQRPPDCFSRTFLIDSPDRADRLRLIGKKFPMIGYDMYRPAEPFTVFAALKFEHAAGWPIGRPVDTI